MEILQPPYWLASCALDEFDGEQLEKYRQVHAKFMGGFVGEDQFQNLICCIHYLSKLRASYHHFALPLPRLFSFSPPDVASAHACGGKQVKQNYKVDRTHVG